MNKEILNLNNKSLIYIQDIKYFYNYNFKKSLVRIKFLKLSKKQMRRG